MSSSCVDLILYEIRKAFGENVEKICQVLLYNEWSTVTDIKSELKSFSSKEINYVLENLIKYNIISVKYDEFHSQSCQFDIDNFILFIISSRFWIMVNSKYESLYRIIFEMFYDNGNLSITELLQKIRIYIDDDNWIQLVINATNLLIEQEVLEITPLNLHKCKTLRKNAIITNVDGIKRILAMNSNPIGSRKRSLMATDEAESNIDLELRINNERFKVLCRNEIIIQDAIDTLGQDAGMVFKIFIDSFEEGSKICYDDPMSLTLFLKIVKRQLKDFDDEKLDECLYLLSKDESVTYIDERLNSNGVLLYFNPSRIVEQLVKKIICDMVQVIFGENGLRIFLFILNNPYIEEMNFRNLVIMSASQINTLLPTMINKGFITRSEFSKTKQYFDEPLVSLFYVDMCKIVRNERESCYQCLYRLNVRKDFESKKKNVILTKMIERDKIMANEESKPLNTDENDPIKEVTEEDEKCVKFSETITSKFDYIIGQLDNSQYFFILDLILVIMPFIAI